MFCPPSLIGNLSEKFDSILDTVLMKQIFKKSVGDFNKIADAVILYH
jgi:hypothetical protein